MLVLLSQSFHRRLWKSVYKYGGERVKESATPNLPFTTKIAYLRIPRGSDCYKLFQHEILLLPTDAAGCYLWTVFVHALCGKAQAPWRKPSLHLPADTFHAKMSDQERKKHNVIYGR